MKDHLIRDHKDFFDVFRSENNNTFSAFGAGKISEKVKQIYYWLDWLSIGLPFNFCEKEATRKYSYVKDISSTTLTSYLTKTARPLEKDIETALLDKFDLMIHGWSEMGSSTHYVGVYAFLQAKQVRQSTFFLAFAPV